MDKLERIENKKAELLQVFVELPEKELKIAELAELWGVSVPTTWNRIKKEGLITFKKKDKNKETLRNLPAIIALIAALVVSIVMLVNKM